MPRIDLDAIEDEWEDEVGRHGHHPRREVLYSRAAQDRIDEADVARVVGVDRGHVDIDLAGQLLTARYAGSMRRTKVVVGDRVRVREPRHETDAARVVARLDRETVLQRSGDDVDEGERVIVANADRIAVVITADHLASGVGFFDRVLLAASVGGLGALLVVNKVDLQYEREKLDDIIDRYEAIGVPVILTSVKLPSGIEELRAELVGRWTAFAGHSGVGKSSLFNLLVPGADREVGEVGRRGGRHTTVASRALALDGGGWLVDTPGVRAFGLGGLEPLDLAKHVPELAGIDCALQDCLHDGEPGCRIAEAKISPERLTSYRRLLAAVRGTDPWEDDD